MDTPIQFSAVLTLALLHLIYIVLLLLAAWRLLPRPAWLGLTGIALAAYGWSLAAMVTFALDHRGFLIWFLDPSAEKNLSALLTSTLLGSIGLTSLLLLWRSSGKQPLWQRFFWIVLAALFLFLALDEYFSIHESISFWRQGYIGLGGLVGLLAVAKVVSNRALRAPLILFLIGLGSLGFAGVFLDAFSNQHVLDFGPLELDFLRCGRDLFGVWCRDYSNTEEMMEMIGAGTMLISLLAILANWESSAELRRSHRLIANIAGLWLLLLVGWMWVLPALESLPARQVDVDYGELRLTSYQLSSDRIRAGETLDVTIYMHTDSWVTAKYSLSLHLYTQGDQEIRSIAQDDMLLGEFVYPTRGWLPYVPVRNRFHLQIPADLPTSASYQLVAILWENDPASKINALTSDVTLMGDGSIVVLDQVAAPDSSIPPAPDSPQYAFAGGFTLSGYSLPQSAQAGEQIEARFWWQTSAHIHDDLTQFLHWFHSETGEYVIFDQIPFQGRFPTRDWVDGIAMLDSWQITLPDEMPAGIYRVHSGMFDVNTQQRVAVSGPDNQPVQDFSIPLAEVVVSQ